MVHELSLFPGCAIALSSGSFSYEFVGPEEAFCGQERFRRVLNHPTPVAQSMIFCQLSSVIFPYQGMASAIMEKARSNTA